MATRAVVTQFWMCLAMRFLNSKIETDEDGNVVNVLENKVGAWIVTIVKHLGLLLLYGGTITLITSIFLTTPETANGRGSAPLVGDAEVTRDSAGLGPGRDVHGDLGCRDPVLDAPRDEVLQLEDRDGRGRYRGVHA